VLLGFIQTLLLTIVLRGRYVHHDMASNENSFSDDIVPTARECPENTTAPFAAAAALSIDDDDDDEFLIVFHTTGHYMKYFGAKVLAVNASHIGWYLA